MPEHEVLEYLLSALYVHSLVLMDHIIIGNDEPYSFWVTGELEEYFKMQSKFLDALDNEDL